jgi:hypothetical protein
VLQLAPELFAEMFKDHPQPSGIEIQQESLRIQTPRVLHLFLLQINHVRGLQIRKDGEWIAVGALPNALMA